MPSGDEIDRYPRIRKVLQTVFNAEDGLAEDVSIRLYQRMVLNGQEREAYIEELQSAFDDSDLSWKRMLCNAGFEVVDADDEASAKSHAIRLLWNPIFSDRT